MNQLDLLYYCDSYPAIGNGHLSRGLKILDELNVIRPKWQCGISGQFSPEAESYLMAHLPSNVEYSVQWGRVRAEIIIVDTMFDPIDELHIDREFFARARQNCEFLVMIAGVRGRINLPAELDLFINHLPDVEVIGNASCETRIGFEYAPVSSEFVPWSKDEDSGMCSAELDNQVPLRILAIIGGNEQQDGPKRLIAALKAIEGVPFHLDMVVSPLFPEGKKSELKTPAGGTLLLHQNVDSMVPLLRQAHAVICTYGNSMYESLTMRKPVFVLSYKRFQCDYAAVLEEKGLVLNLGTFDRIEFNKLKQISSTSTRESLSRAAEKHFMQSGIENIVQVLLSIHPGS